MADPMGDPPPEAVARAVELEPSPHKTFANRIRDAGLMSWAVIGIAVLLAAVAAMVLFVASRISVIFAPLAIAIVITYLLNPIVSRLERRGIRRGWGVLIIWVLFLAVVGTALRFLIPVVARQISGFIDELPNYLERIATEINQFAARRGFDFRVDLSSERIAQFLSENREKIFEILGGVRSLAGQVVHLAVTLVIGFVLSIYLLIDLPKIQRRARALVPARHRDEAFVVAHKVGDVVGGFFRGQLLVATFVGVASAVGLTFVKIPFAVVVGIVAGIFNLVPLIGPFIGAIPAIILGALSGEPIRILWAILVLLGVQQIDNHIISPNVMGRTVKLHPITVMLALLAAGTIAGIFGMLLVIPIIASVKIVAVHLWSRRAVFGVPTAEAPSAPP